jgi:hypothetical protein
VTASSNGLGILAEIDGPMLQHGLQGFQGRRIHVPRADHLEPNRDILAERNALVGVEFLRLFRKRLVVSIADDMVLLVDSLADIFGPPEPEPR